MGWKADAHQCRVTNPEFVARRADMEAASNLALLRRFVTSGLISLVLLASAIIPRGYMIAPSEAGGLHVTACPETNPLARMMVPRQSEEQRLAHVAMGHDMDHSDEEAPSASQASGDCAFAGFSVQGVAQAGYAWDAPFRAYVALAPPFIEDRTEARALRLRPPLRGPPNRV